MTAIDPALLSADDAYKLLVGVVVPRPIAWVTTLALVQKLLASRIEVHH